MKHLVFLLFCLLSTFLGAQFTYSGVLHQTEAELLYSDQQSWDSLLITEAKMSAKGFRLMDLETAKTEGDRFFWGIWIKSNLGQVMKKLDSWPAFIEEKRAKVEEGYVMSEVEAYALTEEEHQFIGVWYKGSVQHKVWNLDSKEGILKKTSEMADQHFYLVDLDVFQTPSNTVKYIALYHEGAVSQKAYLSIESDLKAFNTDLLQRTKSGYRIIDFEKYTENEVTYYLGVYRKGDYPAVLLRDLDQDSFFGHLDMSEQNKLKLVDLDIDTNDITDKATAKGEKGKE